MFLTKTNKTKTSTTTKNLKAETIVLQSEEHKASDGNKGSFEERVFKKTPSLASSVIIKVYNQGKFMGIGTSFLEEKQF